MVDNLVGTLEKILLHKGALLKQAAGTLIAMATASDDTPTVSRATVAMYQGRRRHPAPHMWEQCAEAKSARRLALRRAKYAAVWVLHAQGRV